MQPPASVRHVNGQFQSLGGVQQLLHRHRERAAAVRSEEAIVILGEKPNAELPDVAFWGLGPRSFPWLARRKMRQLAASRPAQITIYHSPWEMPSLVDLDGSLRRIWMIHSDYPELGTHLESRPDAVDAIAVVSETLHRKVTASRPELAREGRVARFDYPISPPPVVVQRPTDHRTDPRFLRIGYCGRLVFDQKRIDRIPAFLQALAAEHVPFQFEILGDGPDELWLREQLVASPNVVFHGRKSGAEYWNVLQSWDVIIFFSDSEGTPISLLEALSVGCVPVFPAIDCGGDALVASLDKCLIYPAGDPALAAKAVTGLANLDLTIVRAMRSHAMALATPFGGDRYFSRFHEFLGRIFELPKRANDRALRKPGWTDLIPFGAQAQLGRLRRKTPAPT